MTEAPRTTLARGSKARITHDRVIEDPGLPIGTRIGDYQVTGEIGQGGMGVVYSARHPEIGKEVAIKVVHRRLSDHPVVKGRVLQEARILTEIRHPNVVDVYSYGQLPDGRSYLVMELVRGTSLAHRIDHDSLSLIEILTVLEQTTAALAACHEQGVVHRDLKPDNILVRNRGAEISVTLFDFGIAKAGGLHMQSGLTCEGTLVGTPEYMSPEQARAREVDARCDVYALGVVAYEMLTGRLPFRGATVVDTLSSILNDSPEPLGRLWQDCPTELEQLIADLLAKEAERRPSIENVRLRLAAIRAQLTAVAPRAVPTIDLPTPAETARADTRLSLCISPVQRWLRRALPIGLLAAILLVVAYLAMQSDSPANAATSALMVEAERSQQSALVQVQPRSSQAEEQTSPAKQTQAKRQPKAKRQVKGKRQSQTKRPAQTKRRSIERSRRTPDRGDPDGLLPFPEDAR